MATSAKGPTNPEKSEREDGALGFPLPVHELPVATAVRPAGALGEDAVKEAASLARKAASAPPEANGGAV
jgi:hypothetical protein